MTDSLISDELRKLIGVPGEPIIFEVEQGAIKRYAEAIDDPNPLYSNVEYARKSKYGGLICPPGFTGWPTKGEMPLFKIVDSLNKAGAPPHLLDGGVEFEFFIPIHAGDILVATTKITNISEKETKSGRMMFTIVETTFLNQSGDIVAISRSTLIFY